MQFWVCLLYLAIQRTGSDENEMVRDNCNKCTIHKKYTHDNIITVNGHINE